MAIIDGMLQELEQEGRTTRRVLERIPHDQLGWKPHAKARTLGELAMHVAIIPGALAQCEKDLGDVCPTIITFHAYYGRQ